MAPGVGQDSTQVCSRVEAYRRAAGGGTQRGEAEGTDGAAGVRKGGKKRGCKAVGDTGDLHRCERTCRVASGVGQGWAEGLQGNTKGLQLA